VGPRPPSSPMAGAARKQVRAVPDSPERDPRRSRREAIGTRAGEWFARQQPTLEMPAPFAVIWRSPVSANGTAGPSVNRDYD
jgi:hypothetical protein